MNFLRELLLKLTLLLKWSIVEIIVIQLAGDIALLAIFKRCLNRGFAITACQEPQKNHRLTLLPRAHEALRYKPITENPPASKFFGTVYPNLLGERVKYTNER